MSKWKLYYPISEDVLHLKVVSRGVIYFEGDSEGLSKIVALAEFTYESELNEVVNAWKKQTSALASEIKTQVKIIGSQQLCNQAQVFFEKNRIEVLKTVERSSHFEVVYTKSISRLSVSKDNQDTVAQVSASNSPKRSGPVKVFIVDDSTTIIHLLSKIFATDAGLNVVGACQDPLKAEDMIAELKPDVVTMDIHMPGLDGVALVKKIVPRFKLPVVMISSISQEEGPAVFNALENGAVDYIQKPTLKELDYVAPLIIERVKNAADAQVQVHSIKTQSQTQHDISLDQKNSVNTDHLILIGSSTGGTEAIKKIFEKLPENIPPILITQHIPPVFSAAFAKRLNELCPFTVKEAEDGDAIEAGCVYVAPGGKQMAVKPASAGGLKIAITDDEPVNRHKPSVDYLFKSACELKNKSMVAVILTGMGADGAREMVNLKKKGVRTIAQNKETCVVYGMPREAVERGAAEFVLPLDQIAVKIFQLCSSQPKKQAS